MKIELKCENEIAYDSPDYISPRGTSQDNSKNPRFNRKVYNLFDKEKKQLNILDLGCSGGGFIRDSINAGCLGIGLEGSDYSQKLKRAEWAIIPDNLFTCDITKKFKLLNEGEEIKFDLITAWEVLEHPKEKDIDDVIENIKNNLSDRGIFVASISNYSDVCNGLELHQCIRSKEWWIKKFEEYGLYEKKELYGYFNKQYVRGRQEYSWNFHIIFSKNNEAFDNIELSNAEKFKDLWVGSKLQKAMEFMVTGDVKNGK